LRVRGAYILADEPLFRNELYRLGGNQLLRGFDEDFFFSNGYAVTTLEYRLLLDRNAYLYVFGDYAWVENNTINTEQTLHPYGVGAGISLETGVGILGLSLAVGATDQQSPDFANPKVHIGYLSLF